MPYVIPKGTRCKICRADMSDRWRSYSTRKGVVFLCGLPNLAISAPLSAHQVLGRCGRRRIVVGQQTVTRTSDLDAFLDHICDREVGRDVDHSDSHDFSMAITVQPVDEHFKLVGEPFSAVTESISRTRLAIIHMRAVTDRFLRITLHARGREIRMILKVTHCCPQGMHYDIAGDFC